MFIMKTNHMCRIISNPNLVSMPDILLSPKYVLHLHPLPFYESLTPFSSPRLLNPFIQSIYLLNFCFYPPIPLIHHFSLSTPFPYPPYSLIHPIPLSTPFPYPPHSLIHPIPLSILSLYLPHPILHPIP